MNERETIIMEAVRRLREIAGNLESGEIAPSKITVEHHVFAYSEYTIDVGSGAESLSLTWLGQP